MESLEPLPSWTGGLDDSWDLLFQEWRQVWNVVENVNWKLERSRVQQLQRLFATSAYIFRKI